MGLEMPLCGMKWSLCGEYLGGVCVGFIRQMPGQRATGAYAGCLAELLRILNRADVVVALLGSYGKGSHEPLVGRIKVIERGCSKIHWIVRHCYRAGGSILTNAKPCEMGEVSSRI